MRLFTRDKSFYKMLLMLALPVSLQNLVTFAVTFADNLMVGKLGDAAVSGVYMGGQIQIFLQLFSAGIEGAILILSTQYWGREDTATIKKITSVGMMFSVIIGAVVNIVCVITPDGIISLFTDKSDIITEGATYLKYVCFSYIFFCITQVFISSMRSVESAAIGLTVSCVSLVVNVCLNYILIFGKLGFDAMGVKGAAIATLISRIVEMVVIVVYVFFIDKKLKFRFRDLFVINKTIMKDVIKYGLPLVGGQLVWGVNMMANSVIMGHYATDVIAGLSVANTLNSLCYVWINGLASAVGIISGKTIGQGKLELMKEYAVTVQISFFLVGLVTGGIVVLLNGPFVSLYDNITPGAAEYAKQFIRVLSVTLIGTCYQMPCLFGLVKSGGDVSFVMKNDTIFVFLVVIPSAIITSKFGLAPWIVFLCLKCDQILKCFVAIVKINRFNWLKNLTRKESEISEI